MKKSFFTLLCFSSILFSHTGSAETLAGDNFETPSRNIHCSLIDIPEEPDSAQLRCDLRSASNTNFAWVIYKNTNKGVKREYVGDFAFDPSSPILSYGNVWENEFATCQSAPTGLTCFHKNTKHGFFLSRAKQRLF